MIIMSGGTVKLSGKLRFDLDNDAGLITNSVASSDDDGLITDNVTGKSDAGLITDNSVF